MIKQHGCLPVGKAANRASSGVGGSVAGLAALNHNHLIYMRILKVATVTKLAAFQPLKAANTAVEWQQASLKVLILYVYLEGCQACHCHSVRDQPRLAAFRSRPPLIEFLRPYVAVSPAA